MSNPTGSALKAAGWPNAGGAATARPWSSKPVGRFGELEIFGANGEEIALINGSDGGDEAIIYPARANAALIVHAVNNIARIEADNARLRKALTRACIDLRAAHPIVKSFLSDEPHGLNQTIEIVCTALQQGDQS